MRNDDWKWLTWGMAGVFIAIVVVYIGLNLAHMVKTALVLNLAEKIQGR